MKLLFTALLTFGLAIGFVSLAMQDPGYVVLARAPYTVRLPLALFVLFVLAIFAVLYLLIGFIISTLRAPARFRAWRRRRAQERAQLQTMQGYAGLIEGDWRRAEQKLLSHPQRKSPLLNYLGAAFAAQQRGDTEHRDGYLNAALEQYPRQRLAIGLTRARLHYQAGEIAAARALLEDLRKIAPGNAAVARVLADAYRRLGEWRELTELLPSLARLGAFAPEELAAREQQAYSHYLTEAQLLTDGGAESKKAFHALPGSAKRDPKVIAGYARQLLKMGRDELAEEVLQRALNRNWSAELIYLYGRTETDTAPEQIKRVEVWQKKYGEHPDLTLALARLHRCAGQSDKARRLFVDAIADGCNSEARNELGALLEELGDHEAALAYYRRGASVIADDEPVVEAQRIDAMPLVR